MTSMPYKNPFEVKFHNELVNFMENLLKIYKPNKELSTMIKKTYLAYKKSDRFTYIHKTVETMEPLIDAIKHNDESIFCQDDVECVCLLPLLEVTINFKQLWGSPLLQNEHKSIIWGYLKNLYILGCHYIDKQDNHIHELVNQLKFDKLLSKKAEQEESEEMSKSESSDKLNKELMNLFNELFGEDSFVYDVFKMEEVQAILEEFRSNNPINVARKYINNGGLLIRQTLENISGKVKERILNGELSRDKIERDIEKVQRIFGKLKSQLPNDPRFKKFFDQLKDAFNIDLTGDSNINPDEIVKQFSDKFQEMSGKSFEEMVNSNPEEIRTTLETMTGPDSDFGKVLSELNNENNDIVNILTSAINQPINEEE